MRCSSCEALLDEYVDGTLAPSQMHRVRNHLRDCSACEQLHRELRVVDGLLLTRRPVALERDFVQAVMTRARLLPPPAPARSFVLPLAVMYIVAAWIAVGAAFAVFYRETPHTATALARTAADVFAAFERAVQMLSPAAPLALSFVIGVLAIDVALLVALVYFYRSLRPRLAEHLAVARRAP